MILPVEESFSERQWQLTVLRFGSIQSVEALHSLDLAEFATRPFYT